MNILTQFLVDGILLEAVEKTIVVYSGRFQPFHKGHFATYQNLISKFGKDNVYIATSNKTDNQKSPFNFKEKKLIMQKMFGIPSNKIVEVRNPYAPMEVLANYPEETTGFITVIGEKDEMRLGGKYFTPYKGKVEKGYRDAGYVYVAPSTASPISGTDVRNWLKAGDETSKKNFLKAYPKFDESVFKLITLKLSKLSEDVISEIANSSGVESDGEPDSGYTPDGTLRIIDRGKPEPWLKQLGMKQIDKPRADAMRGVGRHKDKESQFRKLYYKVQNIKGTDLDPATQPHKVEDWEEVDAGKKVKKIKRFWEAKETDKDIKHPKQQPQPSGLGFDFDSVGEPSPYLSQPKSPNTPNFGAMGGLTKALDKDSNLGIAQSHLEDDWAKIHATIKGPVKPFREDTIPGGLAKGKSLQNLADKHTTSVDNVKDEISKGAKVEMEHTTDKKVAVEIARDHVWEDLHYYEKLAKMEKRDVKESYSGADGSGVGTDSANSTTGIEHNISWDDYDDQEYYIINLPGWDVINKTSSQLMGKDVVDRILPLHNHKGDENGEPHHIKLKKEVKPLNTEGVINESSKEGIVNYYKAVCKKLNLSPLPVKFGSVGKAGAATTFDTKTLKPEYVSFDLGKLQDVERAVLHEIAHHILLLKQGNPYHNCNKSAAFKKVENSLIDKFFYSPESRLLREGVIVEITAGLYGGTIKIGGTPVKIEVELVGADNRTKEFITKVLHIDKQYQHKLPIGSTFNIPARVFRTPGGGWYKIKHKAFEMAKADMDAVEKYADSQMSPEDVELGKETDHFFQRLNDPRNGKEISPAELTGFFKRLAKNKKKFLEFLQKYREFVVTDNRSKINIAFIKVANKLIAKTVMRKADFKSATPVFTTESVNEEVKWEDSTYKKCMLGKLPLTLSIVKQLVDPIKTTSLHITDVEHLPQVDSMQGKQKSISTFTKTTKWGNLVQGKGMHTKGGIIVALSGTVLAQSIMDLWTEPDKKGLRWVNPGTVIGGLGREQDVVFNFAPELKRYKENWRQHAFDGEITNQEKYEFIQKYISAAYKFMLSKKKEFQDQYLNSNTLYYDADWNEVVLNQIKIEKILAIPSNWSDDDIENEKILKQLKQKYKNVEVANKESDIQNFIKKNGGSVIESINQIKDLIMEGGAYGHMNHPFDVQMNLTFADLKNIVKQALNGKLELAREKTDGQALAISWVNGRLVAARNKSHLKSKGKDAMGVQDVISKFAGRGSVSDAFTFAIKDLESAVRGLSDTDKKGIFKDGKCFMNCEIIYPENTNVVPYGTSLLVFHGTMEYNESGDAVGENPAAGAKLAAMVKKINADVQSKFTIQGPPIQKLPVNKDLKAKQSVYLGMIAKLQSEFGLNDKNGVADYHQAWWRQFVDKNASSLDEQQKIGLVKRWAFGDKSFRLADIKDAKLKAWADQTDKKDQAKITKDNLLKFEEIFLGVGADVLSFMTSVLTANPEAAKQQMVGRLETAISSIRATGDAKNLAKLEIELARLNALGGFDKIVPNEGIVFSYKGATYKLTGAFAPLNQILGIFTFSR